MNKIKHAVMLCGIMVLFLAGSVNVLAQENNPFALDISMVETGAEEITVYVTQNAQAGLAALQFTVGYDPSVLEPISRENNGYGFTQEYQNSYAGGLLSCNKKSDGLLIFAGARTGDCAFTGNVAFIKFRVLSKDVKQTSLQLMTETAAVETDHGIEKLDIAQPQATAIVFLQKLQGDVDGDGLITLADAQKILKAALKLAALDDSQLARGDLNGNSLIDLEDAQITLKKALKLIP